MSCQNNIGLLFYDTIHNISRTTRKLNHIIPRLFLTELGLNKLRNIKQNIQLCAGYNDFFAKNVNQTDARWSTLDYRSIKPWWALELHVLLKRWGKMVILLISKCIFFSKVWRKSHWKLRSSSLTRYQYNQIKLVLVWSHTRKPYRFGAGLF